MPRTWPFTLTSALAPGAVTGAVGYALWTTQKDTLMNAVHGTDLQDLNAFSHLGVGLAAPIIAAMVAYPLTLGLHTLRYFCGTGGMTPTGENWRQIHQDARKNALMVGAGFLGVELMHQLFDKTPLRSMVAESLGSWTNFGSAGMITNGALLVVSSLGFGLGMVAAVVANNRMDQKKTTISEGVAAFAVGAAIGAAAAIGYASEVAAYLIPMLTSVAAFAVLPTVTDLSTKAGVSFSKCTAGICSGGHVELDEDDQDLFKIKNAPYQSPG